ncbi:hypothetical protein GCM10009555_104480 [Acrocarpospora macrocephala]|uniref:Uncharacterized protein n=1 Tax=Acrocarpospora macrocephala TaxID=150177 RepID=A0A5M3WWU7_9ACTN|nr:hypothetical protein [Acrocarpospora macrocephala]GES12702.1 hypothetical protein Amac_062990 [Acrocarpospora macrocephala]
MSLYLVDPSEGLTRRARYFVSAHALQVAPFDVDQYRARWLGLGIPATEIDRVAAYSRRWGGLALPPAPHYDGGPRILNPDTPEGAPEEGWWFEAGAQRTAVSYSFMIGPHGEFGVHGDRWVPLHSTVEGWVESVALAHHASTWAKTITKVTGRDVDSLQLDLYEAVTEVAGLADNWWRGADSLVAIYTGEAECMAAPQCQTAYIYSGLDSWGLRG